MSSIGRLNSILTLSCLMAVICVSGLADDGSVSHDALVRSVADGQKHFDSLSSKESPEAVDAMQSVIACKRKLLLHLVEQNKAEEAESIQREVRSLARSVAWVATLREERQEFKEGQSEWTSLADSCKQAIGINESCKAVIPSVRMMKRVTFPSHEETGNDSKNRRAVRKTSARSVDVSWFVFTDLF